MLRGIAGIGLHPFGYCAVRRGAFRPHRLKALDIIDEKHLEAPTDIVTLFDQALGEISRYLPRQISLSIPLFMVELLSIKIPLVPDEAIESALTFRLKKAVSKDINEYSHDYIETNRDANNIQFEVYLFLKETFTQLTECASRHGHIVSYIEPDIFSLFSFLDGIGAISQPEGIMVLAVWPDSVSLGILNGDRIRVSRSINFSLPNLDDAPSDEERSIEGYEGGMDDDLLKKFCVLHEDDSTCVEPFIGGNEGLQIEKLPELRGNKHEESKKSDPMEDYCQDLLVQIMRTRDYYTSVLKMGILKKIELFAPQHLKETIISCLKEDLPLDVDFHGDPLKAAAFGAALR